jgi:hypothetical protein
MTQLHKWKLLNVCLFGKQGVCSFVIVYERWVNFYGELVMKKAYAILKH